jgi:ATP-dependent Clp protease ATP-binding subunit ClpC
MFERYTEKARRAIFFARYEASQYGSPVIDTEHLLLGLLRESKDLYRWMPKATPEAIRKRIDDQSSKRPSIPTSVDLPLSGAAKRVLKNAANEADRLADKHIGTEHLLLGLLDEEDCLAAALLREGGADAGELRMYYAGSNPPKPWSFQRASYRDLGFRSLSAETVEIHGSAWNVDYVRDAVQICRATTGIGAKQRGSRATW